MERFLILIAVNVFIILVASAERASCVLFSLLRELPYSRIFFYPAQTSILLVQLIKLFSYSSTKVLTLGVLILLNIYYHRLIGIALDCIANKHSPLVKRIWSGIRESNPHLQLVVPNMRLELISSL